MTDLEKLMNVFDDIGVDYVHEFFDHAQYSIIYVSNNTSYASQLKFDPDGKFLSTSWYSGDEVPPIVSKLEI